jgi:hypothetical protein
MITITGTDGAVQLPEDEAAEVAERVVTERSGRPRG